jgi:hypothetical protein
MFDQVGATVRPAIEALIGVQVLQPEGTGHIDDAHFTLNHAIDDFDAHAVRQPHQHDVQALDGFRRRRILEHQRRATLQVRQRRSDGLADVIGRADTDELHVRMHQQPPHQLRPRKPRAS